MSDPKMMMQWWQSPLGQYVTAQERTLLEQLNHHFQGFFHIQLDGNNKILPEVSHFNKAFLMTAHADLQGHVEALPFKRRSIDALLLPHVLEFSHDPHQVLREAERVLVADGSLVLCCFNPLSLWGLRRLFSWKKQPPWKGHYFSQTRIKDWLALLNFEVITTEKLLFRPPVNNQRWLMKFSFLECWAQRFWPIFGGAYIIVARKRTIPLTPIRLNWRDKMFFPVGPLAKKAASRWSSKIE